MRSRSVAVVLAVLAVLGLTLAASAGNSHMEQHAWLLAAPAPDPVH